MRKNSKLLINKNLQYKVPLQNCKKVLKTILRKVLFFFGYCLVIPASYVMPKKNYVVLTTRFGDFEGNLKYFFLYLNSIEEKDLEFIFLTEKKEIYSKLKDSGYNVWLYPGLLTFFNLLRTRILIVDGNEWAKNLKYFFLFRAKKVQVWHGTGLKTIGLLKPAIKGLGRFRQALKKEYIYYDLLALSSEYQAKVRREAFRYGHLLINGLPRNDIFFKKQLQNDMESNKLIEKFTDFKKKGFKIVIYTPTWRKYSEDFNHLDFSALDDFARRNQIMFVIKLHSKHSCELNESRYSNVAEYDRYADVYPLLSITDLMITDFSSIYLDFLLLDKPIIFFPYDKEEYIYGERELLLNYDEITPGPKCYNQSKMQEEIHKHIVGGRDEYKLHRNELRDKFFHYKDGKSSERLWSAIKDHVL